MPQILGLTLGEPAGGATSVEIQIINLNGAKVQMPAPAEAAPVGAGETAGAAVAGEAAGAAATEGAAAPLLEIPIP